LLLLHSMMMGVKFIKIIQMFIIIQIV
jgi:hypothetical protein